MSSIKDYYYNFEKNKYNFDFDNDFRIKLIFILIYISLVFHSFSTILYVYEIDMLERVIFGKNFTLKELDIFEKIKTIVYFIKLVLLFALTILFLKWFSKVYYNLNSLKNIDLKFSPSISIWGFLIPIFNLVIPIVIIKEIISNYRVFINNTNETQSNSINLIFYFIWLISFYFMFFCWFFYGKIKYINISLEEMVIASYNNMVFDLSVLTFLILTIFFIKRINYFEKSFIDFLTLQGKLSNTDEKYSAVIFSKYIKNKVNSLLNNETKAKMAIMLNWMLIFFIISGIISTIFELNLLNKIKFEEFVTDEELDYNDDRQLYIAIFQFSFFILTSFYFIKWFYYAYLRIHTIDNLYLLYKPKMAIWSFFIPFVNLIRPYKIANEIIKNNKYLILKKDENFEFKDKRYFVYLWWGFNLLSNIISYQVFKIGFRAEQIDELMTFSKLLIFSDTLDLLSNLSTIFFVKYVYKYENEVYNLYKKPDYIE